MVSLAGSAQPDCPYRHTGCAGLCLAGRLVGICRLRARCYAGRLRIPADDASRGLSSVDNHQPGSEPAFPDRRHASSAARSLARTRTLGGVARHLALVIFPQTVGWSDGRLVAHPGNLHLPGLALSLILLLRGFQIGFSGGFWWLLTMMLG